MYYYFNNVLYLDKFLTIKMRKLLTVAILILSVCLVSCDEEDDNLERILADSVWIESADPIETCSTMLAFKDSTFCYSIELPLVVSGDTISFKRELEGTYTYDHPMVVLTFKEENKEPWILMINNKEMYYHGGKGINCFTKLETEQNQ